MSGSFAGRTNKRFGFMLFEAIWTDLARVCLHLRIMFSTLSGHLELFWNRCWGALKFKTHFGSILDFVASNLGHVGRSWGHLVPAWAQKHNSPLREMHDECELRFNNVLRADLEIFASNRGHVWQSWGHLVASLGLCRGPLAA